MKLFALGNEIYEQKFTYNEIVAAITLAAQPCAQDLDCEDICEIVKEMVPAWENLDYLDTQNDIAECAYVSEYVRNNASDWVKMFKEEKF